MSLKLSRLEDIEHSRLVQSGAPTGAVHVVAGYCAGHRLALIGGKTHPG